MATLENIIARAVDGMERERLALQSSINELIEAYCAKFGFLGKNVSVHIEQAEGKGNNPPKVEVSTYIDMQPELMPHASKYPYSVVDINVAQAEKGKPSHFVTKNNIFSVNDRALICVEGADPVEVYVYAIENGEVVKINPVSQNGQIPWLSVDDKIYKLPKE